MSKQKRNFSKIGKAKKVMSYGVLGAMLVGSMAPVINQAIKNKKAYKLIYKFNHTYFHSEEEAKKAQSRFLSLSSIFANFTNDKLSVDENDPNYRKAKTILEDFIAKMFAIRYFVMDTDETTEDHFEWTGQSKEAKEQMKAKEEAGELKYGELKDITDLIHFAFTSEDAPDIFTETDRVLMSILGDKSNHTYSVDEIRYVNALIRANHYKKSVEGTNHNHKVLIPASKDADHVGDFSGNNYDQKILDDFNKYYNLLKELKNLEGEMKTFKDTEGTDYLEYYEKLEKTGAFLGWNNKTRYSNEEIELRDTIKKIEQAKQMIANLESGKGDSGSKSKPGKNYSGWGDETNRVYDEWELRLAELIQRRQELEKAGNKPAPVDAVEGVNYLGTGDKTGKEYDQDLIDLRKKYLEKKSKIAAIVERIKLLRGLGTEVAVEETKDSKGNVLTGGQNPNDKDHKHQDQVGLGDGVDYTHEYNLVKLYEELKQAVADAKAKANEYIEELKKTSTKLQPTSTTDVKERNVYEVINSLLTDDSTPGWNWKRNYSEKEVRLRNLNKYLEEFKEKLDELLKNGIAVAPTDATEGTNESGTGLKDGSSWTEAEIALRDLIKQNKNLAKEISNIDNTYGNSLRHPPKDAKYSKDGKHYEPKGLADDEKYSLRFASAVKNYLAWSEQLKSLLTSLSKYEEKYKNESKFSSPNLQRGTKEWADAYLSSLVENNAIPGQENSKKQYSKDEIAYRELNKKIEASKAEEQRLQTLIDDLKGGKSTYADRMIELYEEYKTKHDDAVKPIEGLNNEGTGDKSGNTYAGDILKLTKLYEKYHPILEAGYNRNLDKNGYFKGSIKLSLGEIFNQLRSSSMTSGYNNPHGGGDQNQTVFTTDKKNNTLSEYQKHMMNAINGMSKDEAKEVFKNLLSALKSSTEVVWGKKGNEWGFYYSPDSTSLDQGDKSGRTYINLFSDDELDYNSNPLLQLLRKMNLKMMNLNTRTPNKGDLAKKALTGHENDPWSKDAYDFLTTGWWQYRDFADKEYSFNSVNGLFNHYLFEETNLKNSYWNQDRDIPTYKSFLINPNTGKKFDNINEFQKFMSQLSFQEKWDFYQKFRPEMQKALDDFKKKHETTSFQYNLMKAQAKVLEDKVGDFRKQFIDGNVIFESLLKKWSEYTDGTDVDQMLKILSNYSLDNFQMDFDGDVESYDEVEKKLAKLKDLEDRIAQAKQKISDQDDQSNDLATLLANLKKEDTTGKYFDYINTHVADHLPVAGKNTKDVGAEDDQVHTIEQQRAKQLYDELFGIVYKTITGYSSETDRIAKTEQRVVFVLNHVTSNTMAVNQLGTGDKTGNDYKKELGEFSSALHKYKMDWNLGMQGLKLFKRLADEYNKNQKSFNDYISYKSLLSDYITVSEGNFKLNFLGRIKNPDEKKQYEEAKARIDKVTFPTSIGEFYKKQYEEVLNEGYADTSGRFSEMIENVALNRILLDFEPGVSNDGLNKEQKGDGSNNNYDQSIVDSFLNVIQPLRNLLNSNADYVTVNTTTGQPTYKSGMRDQINKDWPDGAQVNLDNSPLLNTKGVGDRSGNNYASDDPKVVFFDKYRSYLSNKESVKENKSLAQQELDKLTQEKDSLDMEVKGYLHVFEDDKHKYIPIPLIKLMKEFAKKVDEVNLQKNKVNKYFDDNNFYIKPAGGYYGYEGSMNWGLKVTTNEWKAKVEKALNDKFLKTFNEDKGFTPEVVEKIVAKLKQLLSQSTKVIEEESKMNPLLASEHLKIKDILERVGTKNITDSSFWYDSKYVFDRLELLNNVNVVFNWLKKKGAHLDGQPNKIHFSDNYKIIREQLLKIYKKEDGSSYTEETLPFDKAATAFIKMTSMVVNMSKTETENFDKQIGDDSVLVNGVETRKYNVLETNVYNPNSSKGNKFSIKREDYENNGYTKQPDYFANSNNLDPKKWNEYNEQKNTDEPEFLAAWVFQGVDLENNGLNADGKDEIDFLLDLMQERIGSKTKNTNWVKGDGSGNTYQNWMVDRSSQDYKDADWLRTHFWNLVRNAGGSGVDLEDELRAQIKKNFEETNGDDLLWLKKYRILMPDDALEGKNVKATGDASGNTYSKEDIELYESLKKLEQRKNATESFIKDRVAFIDKGVKPAPDDALVSPTGEAIDGKGDQSGNTYSKEEWDDAHAYVKLKKRYAELFLTLEDFKANYETQWNDHKDDSASTREAWEDVVNPKYKNVVSGWNNPLLYSQIERDYKGKSDQVSIIVKKIAESEKKGTRIAPDGAIVGENKKPVGNADGKIWTKANIDKRDNLKFFTETMYEYALEASKLIKQGINPAPETALAHKPSNDPDDMNALHPKDVGDASDNYYEIAVFTAQKKLNELLDAIKDAEEALDKFVTDNDESYIKKAVALMQSGAVEGVNTPEYWSDEEIELRDIAKELENLKIELQALESHQDYDKMMELTDESIAGKNIAPVGTKDDKEYSKDEIELRDLSKTIIDLEHSHGMSEYFGDPIDEDGNNYNVQVTVKSIVNGLVDEESVDVLDVNPRDYYGSIDLDAAVLGTNYKPYGDETNSIYTQEEIDARDNINQLKKELAKLELRKFDLENQGVKEAPEKSRAFTSADVNMIVSEYINKNIFTVDELMKKQQELENLVGKHIDAQGDASDNIYSPDLINKVKQLVNLRKAIETHKKDIQAILDQYKDDPKKLDWIQNVMRPKGDARESKLGMNWSNASFDLREIYNDADSVGVGRTAINKPYNDVFAVLGHNSLDKGTEAGQYYVLFGDLTNQNVPKNPSSQYIRDHMLGSDKVRKAYVLKTNMRENNDSLKDNERVFTSLESLLKFLMAHHDDEKIFPKKLLNTLSKLNSTSKEASDEYAITVEEVTKDYYDKLEKNYKWGDQ